MIRKTVIILILTFFGKVTHGCLYEFTAETVGSSISLNQAGFNDYKVLDIALDKNAEPVVCYYDDNDIIWMDNSGHSEKVISYGIESDFFKFVSDNWGDYAAVFGFDGLYYKQSWHNYGDIYYLENVPDQICDVVFSSQNIPYLLTQENGNVYFSRFDVKINKWQNQLIVNSAYPIAMSISNDNVVVLVYDFSISKARLFTTNGTNWFGYTLPAQCQNAIQYELDVRIDGTSAVVCRSENNDIYYCQFQNMFESWQLESVVRAACVSANRFDFIFKPDGKPAIVYPFLSGNENQLILTESHSDGKWCSTVIATSPLEKRIYSPSLIYSNPDTVYIAYFIGSDNNLTGNLYLQRGIWNPADFNRNSKIDLIDLTVIAGSWQSCGPIAKPFDLTADDEINIADLAVFAQYWLASK